MDLDHEPQDWQDMPKPATSSPRRGSGDTLAGAALRFTGLWCAALGFVLWMAWAGSAGDDAARPTRCEATPATGEAEATACGAH